MFPTYYQNCLRASLTEAQYLTLLEAIFRKLESLEAVQTNQLAGKIGVVIDLLTRLPVEIWFRENAKVSDMCLVERTL